MERGSSSGREAVGDAVYDGGLGEELAVPLCLGTGCPVPLGTCGALYPQVLMVWLLACSARGTSVIIVSDVLFLQIQLSRRCWGAVSGMSEHPLTLPDKQLSWFSSTSVREDGTVECDIGRL